MSLLTSISFTNVDFNNLQASPGPITQGSFKNINIHCHNDMRQFAGDVAEFIFNYIASKATMNQSRMVHFNMLVSDNYNNPELVILTTFALNAAYFKTKEGIYNNIKQALQSCAVWIVDRRVNYATINNPILAESNRANINDIRRAASEYVAEAQIVEQALNQTFISRAVNPNQGFQDQGFHQQDQIQGFDQGMNNNRQMNTGTLSGFGGQTQQLRGFDQMGMGQNTNISSVITRVDTDGNQRLSNQSRFKDNMGAETLSFRPVQQVKQVTPARPKPDEFKPVPQETPAPFKSEENYRRPDGNINFATLEVTDKPWRSSDYQKQPLAYDTRNLVNINRIIPVENGKTEIVVSTLKKAPLMDRSAHSLPSSENFLNKVMPSLLGTTRVDSREKFRDASLLKATSTLKEIRDITSENDYVKRLDNFRTTGHFVLIDPVASIQEAITYARLAAMAYVDGEIGSYQLEFNLAKEIPIQISDLKEVTKLSSYKTIQSLVAKIKGTIEDEHASQSLRTFMVQINSYLAKQFMDYIHFYLCLGDYTNSNSFIDDAMNLMEDISTDYGKSYKDLLLANQEKFIETNLNFGDALQSKASDLSGNFMHDKKDTEQEITVALLPIWTPCMITCTEFLDTEYSLKTPAGIGAMFTADTTTTGLFELVKESVTHPFSVGLQTKIKRFFIATLDDVVYETNIGLAKESAPLLIMKM